MFKLPLDLSDRENTTYNISINIGTDHLLMKCSFILCATFTTSHKGIQAVNQLLKDILNNNLSILYCFQEISVRYYLYYTIVLN